MNQIITYQLSKAAAVAIFEANAVFHSSGDAMDIHRVVELLGEPAARYIDRTTKYKGIMEGGRDYNATVLVGMILACPITFCLVG